MGVTDGVGCLICHDSAQCSPFKLTCGHAFGRSCMMRWMERSGQKNCLTCTKRLTPDEVKQINHIPLYDQMVNISIKAIPSFSRAALISFGCYYTGLVGEELLKGSLSSIPVIDVAETTAVIISTATIGALVNANDFTAESRVAAGAAVGACVTAAFKLIAAAYGLLHAPTAWDCYKGFYTETVVASLAYDTRE